MIKPGQSNIDGNRFKLLQLELNIFIRNVVMTPPSIGAIYLAETRAQQCVSTADILTS